MARALLDINVFSEEWFAPILKELADSKNVVFLYGKSEEFKREIGKARKALEFYKIIGQMKTSNGVCRRLDVSAEDINVHVDYLSRQQCFANSGDCDDPHIFSIIYSKPTRYLFTMDMRIARCRNHIIKYVDNRYCDFIVIGSADVYMQHRQSIVA